MHFVDILSQFCTFWAIFAKNHIWYHIECHARVLFGFCLRNFAIFGAFQAILSHIMGILDHFGTILGQYHIWYHIECHARVLFSFCLRNFAIFSHFGAISGHFEPYYGHFGSFWDHFGPISDMEWYGMVCYAILGQYMFLSTAPAKCPCVNRFDSSIIIRLCSAQSTYKSLHKINIVHKMKSVHKTENVQKFFIYCIYIDK